MKKTEFTRFDRMMAAVSFAEEAEFDTAKELLLNKDKNNGNAFSSEMRPNHSMDHEKGMNKQKAVLTTMVLTGIISIGLYVALLTNQDILNDNFAKGGLYAFLPILTAFVFSYFHGTFTGHFWTVLGVEASKKKMEVK